METHSGVKGTRRMREYITPNSVASEIRMIRTNYKGTFLLVEGDNDRKTYECFINQSECIIEPLDSKDFVIEVSRILEQDGFKGLVAIVDSDFMKLDGSTVELAAVFLTDSHDLEMMIISSKALQKVLSEFGAHIKIAEQEKEMLDLLLAVTAPLGFLRWLSSEAKDNLNLKFEEINFDKFIIKDKKKLTVNIDKMVTIVKNNSTMYDINSEEFENKIHALEEQGYDLLHICNGHDVVEVLAIGLKKVFGNRRARCMNAETLEGIMRIAYDYSCFVSTQLYASIKDWEKSNRPFRVLNCSSHELC
jgi:hypothetical protein